MLFHPVYAGPGVRFKGYLPGLQASGVEIRVFTATPDLVKRAASGMANTWAALPNGALLPEETVSGVPIQRVRVPDELGNRRDAVFARAVADYCRRKPRPPEVLQVFSARLAWLPALWRLRRMGIPVVSTWTMMPRLSRNRLKKAVAIASIRWPSHLVDCFVVSSEIMLRAVRDLGIRTRMEVIPHGVDTRRFRPVAGPQERAVVRMKLGLPPDVPILLFVGPVAPRKRVDLLLEAWCRLAPAHRDLRLVVVGPRFDVARPSLATFHAALEALADRSGARDRLHFVGLVDDVDLYMRAADVFVFTSSREGFGNVVAEAMGSALPVITTPFEGLATEFGVPGREFVLAGSDPDSIAAEVSRLLTEPRRRKEFGARGRAWVEKTLNIDRTIDQYSQLYRDVARFRRGMLR